ncbi:MAG: hypothetical protein QXU11_12085 [Thermoproteota archaeon]
MEKLFPLRMALLCLILTSVVLGNEDSYAQSGDTLFRYTAIIPGTSSFDVDSGKAVGLAEKALADLWWEQVTKTERYLVPLNGAKIANLGIVDFDSITDCSDYPLSEQKIDGSIGSNTIPNGTVLIIKTNMGKYAKMRIDSYGYNLHVTVVYQSDGTTRLEAMYQIILRANLPANYFWAKLDAENKTGSTILFKVSGIEHVILVPSEIVVGRTKYIFSQWSNGMTQNPMTIRLTEDTELTATYRTEVFLEVSSELGTTSGSGWYKVDEEVTISISPTVVSKDFFTNYVFEGWRLDGSIVSTSPTYSFVVDRPVTLVASWRTEIKLSAIGLIVGVILFVIVSAAILMARRRKSIPPPPPPTL